MQLNHDLQNTTWSVMDWSTNFRSSGVFLCTIDNIDERFSSQPHQLTSPVNHVNKTRSGCPELSQQKPQNELIVFSALAKLRHNPMSFFETTINYNMNYCRETVLALRIQMSSSKYDCQEQMFFRDSPMHCKENLCTEASAYTKSNISLKDTFAPIHSTSLSNIKGNITRMTQDKII